MRSNKKCEFGDKQRKLKLSNKEITENMVRRKDEYWTNTTRIALNNLITDFSERGAIYKDIGNKFLVRLRDSSKESDHSG